MISLNCLSNKYWWRRLGLGAVKPSCVCVW